MTKVDRRKKINIMLNDEERRIITEKAIEYGYGPHLAAYVRSACIYESLYKEEIEGKFEITKIMSDYISVVNRIQYEQSQLTKKIMLNEGDIKMIKENNTLLHNEIRKLIKTIENTLTVKQIKESKQKLNK